MTWLNEKKLRKPEGDKTKKDRERKEYRDKAKEAAEAAKTAPVKTSGGSPMRVFDNVQRSAPGGTRVTGGTHRSYLDEIKSRKAPTPSAKQTSLGNPAGLRNLENPRKVSVGGNRSHEDMANPANARKQTSLGNPKAFRDLDKPKPTIKKSDIPRSQYEARDAKTGFRKVGSSSVNDVISKAFKEQKAETSPKKKFDKNEVMKERRAAAEAQGKGKWNKEEVMRQRREAAKAQGKGNWNAEEEMRKRREAAMAKKKKG